MLKKLFGSKPPKRVALADGSLAFEVGRNKTILESALEQGIAYPHDCTVGTCGSCRTRLASGKVDAITPFGYTLSREELQGGFILACQAVPLTDLVIEVEMGVAEVVRCAARLVESRDLTHDIKKVTWQVEVPLAYRAGQYMNITWPGGSGHRSYSFSAAPAEGGQTLLSTFIRKVPGGAFTERLFGEDMADVAFEIDGPHGQFWLREAPAHGPAPILLIGGGSGLSPLMSLLEDAVARGIKRDAILLFGGRGERDLYCLDEIAAIATRWQGRFAFWPVLSEEAVAKGDTGAPRQGFVTAEIPSALAELGADLGGTAGLQAYLCGPPGMIDAGVAALTAAGVALSDIHYDKFTDASTRGA